MFSERLPLGRAWAPRAAWREEFDRARSDWNALVAPTLEPAPGKIMTQAQALHVVNKAMREDSYIVAAAGSLPGDVIKLWDTRGNRRAHLDFGFSCMTYEIPAGVGLALAGERNVAVVVGDGTYLMNPSDLLVAARENTKMTVCVFNNHGYQIIRDLQMLTTGGSFATEFRGRDNAGQTHGAYLDIDLAANAASLGARVHAVSTVAELEAALKEADATPGPTVIVIEVDPYQMSVSTKNAFWDIAPPQVSANEKTRELRRSYEDRRDKIQRHYL